MDVWGTIYRDQWSGRSARHEIERDDGRLEVFESASNYFDVPRSDDERDLLGQIEGPVLDLGAGPGSYALYLQNAGPRGRLLFSMIDPLDTSDEGRLAYQQRNLEKGLPPGLIKMRIKYAGFADEWMHLWMLTEEEFAQSSRDAGWTVREERRRGFWRLRLLQAVAS